MTITLTKEELQEFQYKLLEWYDKRTRWVLEGGFTQDYGRGGRQTFNRRLDDFEKENPKPDWHSLL